MRSRWLVLATCALLVMTWAPPPDARADAGAAATVDETPAEQLPIIGDGADIDRWDWGKFFTYAGCAAGIAIASTGAGIVAMVIACGRAASLYWST